MEEFSFNQNPKPKPSKSPKEPNTDPSKVWFGLIGLASFSFLLVLGLFVPRYVTKPVSGVEIHGIDQVRLEEIRKAMQPYHGQNWWTLDPYFLSVELQKIHWVKAANVKKRGDRSLVIEVIEHHPIAYLNTKKGLFLLSQDKKTLPLPSGPFVADLPVLKIRDLQPEIGKPITDLRLEMFFQLQSLLAENPILPFDSLSELHLEDPLNPILVVQGTGTRIYLGPPPYAAKLAKLEKALPKLQENATKLEYLDLRNFQGIAFKERR